uniref:Uncharacterized protein n=1 Tax=Romanomermis culicivorax TaxID=13658 RepID=A0A915J8P1_ROMCU
MGEYTNYFLSLINYLQLLTCIEMVTSEYLYNTIKTGPRSTECYNCMSKSLEADFQKLASFFHKPLKFDNRCNDPFFSRGIPLTKCNKTCVMIKEAEFKMGMIVGHVVIRGCLDNILVRGFNPVALETYGFTDSDTCEMVSWREMSNHGKWRIQQAKMCTCWANRCNGAMSGATKLFDLLPLIFTLNLLYLKILGV